MFEHQQANFEYQGKWDSETNQCATPRPIIKHYREAVD